MQARLTPSLSHMIFSSGRISEQAEAEPGPDVLRAGYSNSSVHCFEEMAHYGWWQYGLLNKITYSNMYLHKNLLHQEVHYRRESFPRQHVFYRCLLFRWDEAFLIITAPVSVVVSILLLLSLLFIYFFQVRDLMLSLPFRLLFYLRRGSGCSILDFGCSLDGVTRVRLLRKGERGRRNWLCINLDIS